MSPVSRSSQARDFSEDPRLGTTRSQAPVDEPDDPARTAIDQRTLEILEHRRRTARVRRRGWIVRRALAIGDIVGLSLAFLIVEALYVQTRKPLGDVSPETELLLFIASLPIWVLFAKLQGLYDQDEERANHSTVDDLVGVFHLITAGVWALFICSWALPETNTISAPKLVLFWGFAIGLVTLCRTAARALSRHRIDYFQNTVIVGGGEVGQLVARKLMAHPEYGLNLVGFVDANPREHRQDIGPLRVLGAPDRLPELIVRLDIERVIFAFSQEETTDTLALIRALKQFDLQIDIVPRVFEVVGPRVAIHTVEGIPLVGLPPTRPSRSSRAVKRAMDLVGASLMLLFTAPLFAYIAWRVKRDSPGPVFFRQERMGIRGEPFTMLKFRSMVVDTDPEAHRKFTATMTDFRSLPGKDGLYKLDQGDKVTNSGRWLRRTSLDELPQLINVLRGEMSLVGPRPCMRYEIELFQPHHFDRFLVPPGLTGLWQVTARAHSSFGEALEMDVVYARDWSLGLDLRLLLRTPRELLRQRNATA
jgi:exopolysaccharide biosynthesis polyprenyl glycosylphosphotransferase